ncbi:MAG: hypothetical protein ACKVTZ_03065 [Bacteroidia bacterium]
MKNKELLVSIIQYCIDKQKLEKTVTIDNLNARCHKIIVETINTDLNLGYQSLVEGDRLKREIDDLCKNKAEDGSFIFISLKTIEAWAKKDKETDVRPITILVCQRLLFQPQITSQTAEITLEEAPFLSEKVSNYASNEEETSPTLSYNYWKIVSFVSLFLLMSWGLWSVFFSAPKVQYLQIATSWTYNSTMAERAREFALSLEQKSKGKLKIIIYYDFHLPNNALNTNKLNPPITQVYDALKRGEVDMLYTSAYYNKSQPYSIFFSAIPGGMEFSAMKTWMGNELKEEDADKWQEGYALWRKVHGDSLMVFPAGNTGEQWGGFYKQKITSIADYQGKKMRVGGGFAKLLLESLGASTYDAYEHDLLKVMAKGELDWIEFMNPTEDERIGLHLFPEKYPYIEESEGVFEPNSMLELLVNKAKFAQLSPEIQAIFYGELAKFHDLHEVMFEKNEKIKEGMKKNHTFYRLDSTTIRNLHEKTAQVFANYVNVAHKNDAFLQQIARSYLTHCQCELLNYLDTNAQLKPKKAITQ